MAGKTPEHSETTEPATDPAAVYAAVLRLVRFLDPTAVEARIVYRAGNGTWGKVPVLTPEGAASPDVPALTPMEQAVVQVIEEMRPGTVLSFDEIASRSGFSNSDSLREFVRKVAAVGGRLVKAHRGWERT